MKFLTGELEAGWARYGFLINYDGDSFFIGIACKIAQPSEKRELRPDRTHPLWSGPHTYA